MKNKDFYESEDEVLSIDENYYIQKKEEQDAFVPDFNDEILIPSPSKYFLYCEGKNEKKYFNLLRKHFNPTNRIKIISFIPDQNNKDGTNARKLVEQFIIKKNEQDFDTNLDKFYLIFDRDKNHSEPNYDNNNLDYAILKCNQNNIIPIFSNPCFEVWRICEYKKLKISEFPFESKKVKTLLNEIKRENQIEFSIRLLEAKKNARILYNRACLKNIKIHSEESFPLTEVFFLVEELEKQFH